MVAGLCWSSHERCRSRSAFVGEVFGFRGLGAEFRGGGNLRQPRTTERQDDERPKCSPRQSIVAHLVRAGLRPGLTAVLEPSSFGGQPHHAQLAFLGGQVFDQGLESLFSVGITFDVVHDALAEALDAFGILHFPQGDGPVCAVQRHALDVGPAF